MKKFGILGVLLVALVVRLILINQSFWMDEAAQALQSMRPLNQQLLIGYDFQPPLLHLLVHTMTYFGAGEVWLRMASVIPGVITVYVIYCIGKLLDKKHGSFIGMTSAFLLALSAFHVYFSQELRQYVLAGMWAATSWYALLKWERATAWRYPWMFLISSIAGFYTMYVYPFLFLAQVFYMLMKKTIAPRRVFGSVVVVFLAFLPWLPGFLGQLRTGEALRLTLPGWDQVVSTPQWKALPLVFLKFIGGVKRIDFTWVDLVYFGVPLLVMAIMTVKTWKTRTHSMLWLLFCWGFLSVVLAWVISFMIPVIAPKRVIFALPALYLLFASMLARLPAKVQKGLLLGAIIYQLIGLSIYWTTPSYQRENWREVMVNMARDYPQNSTIVVFGFQNPFAPWTYYANRFNLKYKTIGFPTLPLQSPQQIDAQMRPALAFAHVLVFDYLRDLTDPHRVIEAWLEANGYQGVSSIPTNTMGFIRSYLRKEPVQ